MEYHFKLQNRTQDPQTSIKANGHSVPESRESRKFGFRLKFEKADVSYSDFHPEKVENVKSTTPRSTEFRQNQQADEKQKQNEELVRYMSNLPSFLERGKNIQERAFNVGVLDWQLLEKWQHTHNIGNRHSPSSSNTPSFSSREGGSTSYLSRGRSSFPARQKMHHPTLQSHLYGSPIETNSYDSKLSEGNDLLVQGLKSGPCSSMNVQQSILGTIQSSDNCGEHRLKNCKEKDADLCRISGTRRSQGLEDVKGKMKVQDCEPLERYDNLQASVDDITNQSCAGKQEKVVFVAPKVGLENTCCSKPQLFISSEKKMQGIKGTRRRSFSHFNNSDSISAELSCDVSPSFTSFDAVTRHSQKEQTCSTTEKKNIFSAELNQHVPNCGTVPVSPSRSKKLQEKTPITALKDPYEIKSSEGSNLKVGTAEAVKVRNPSPTRRFSISIGRMGRISSSSGTSTTQQLPAKNLTVISGAEQAGISTASDNNKLKANGKGRSSPLRRLLDPLIKPKAFNSDHSAGASLADSTLRERNCKSSDGRGESAALHSVKMKLDLKHCRTIEAEDPHCSRKHGSSTVQALLQVAVKNDLPLFTFAVENKSDILAATMRKISSSEKDGFNWIYTFFFIQEMKKKNGTRVNQGSKDRGNGYVPNVVAQMKITDDLIRQNTLDESFLKECVLFSMGRRETDQQTSDLQLNNELAAIVVRVPKKTAKQSYQNKQQNGNCNDSSITSSREPFQNVRGSCGSGKNEDNVYSVPSVPQLNMTVIFPGGNHGVPIKGEPSSLIKRWKSGGSCDCGGWDLGCRLRVLTNHAQCDQGSGSIETRPTAGRFELFSQGEELDQKRVFSLSTFKDGIFSVEFNSSIKVLQAFSISLAVLSSLKPAEFSEASKLFADKPPGDVTVSEANETKVCSRAQEEFPAKYVSYPPLSPAGRV